jgi:hypothetical protein
VTVSRGGDDVFDDVFHSGNMTPDEAALGCPRSTPATHTEARAVRSVPLQAGDEMVIHGSYPPCPTCKGLMNDAVEESGASIRYLWDDNEWIAGR